MLSTFRSLVNKKRATRSSTHTKTQLSPEQLYYERSRREFQLKPSPTSRIRKRGTFPWCTAESFLLITRPRLQSLWKRWDYILMQIMMLDITDNTPHPSLFVSYNIKGGNPCMWSLRADTVSLLHDQRHSRSRGKGKAAFTPLSASALRVHDLWGIRHLPQEPRFCVIIQEMTTMGGSMMVMLMTRISLLWIIQKLLISEPSLLFYSSTCLLGVYF